MTSELIRQGLSLDTAGESFFHHGLSRWTRISAGRAYYERVCGWRMYGDAADWNGNWNTDRYARARQRRPIYYYYLLGERERCTSFLSLSRPKQARGGAVRWRLSNRSDAIEFRARGITVVWCMSLSLWCVRDSWGCVLRWSSSCGGSAAVKEGGHSNWGRAVLQVRPVVWRAAERVGKKW